MRVVIAPECQNVGGILRYFILMRKSLPSPDGPLSKVVPSEGILLTNKEVKEVLEGDAYGIVPPNSNTSGNHTRGHFIPDEKATVGKKQLKLE